MQQSEVNIIILESWNEKDRALGAMNQSFIQITKLLTNTTKFLLLV